MAKKSMVARDVKRTKICNKYRSKREVLKAQIAELTKADEIDYEALEKAQIALQKLPRDANPIRGRRRCRKSGRPHGVYRRVGLGRNMFRLYAMLGWIPGLKKASW